MINMPLPTSACSTDIHDKSCLPRVVYKANIEKIMDLVVAIAIPWVCSTNTWFHAGIHKPSKKLNITNMIAHSIHDCSTSPAMIRSAACMTVARTRARWYHRFSHTRYAYLFVIIIAIPATAVMTPHIHGCIPFCTKRGKLTMKKNETWLDKERYTSSNLKSLLCTTLSNAFLATSIFAFNICLKDWNLTVIKSSLRYKVNTISIKAKNTSHIAKMV